MNKVGLIPKKFTQVLYNLYNKVISVFAMLNWKYSLTSRNPRGQSALRDLLHPLIKEILDDKEFMINTNPVDVYKNWVNQKESQTGLPR